MDTPEAFSRVQIDEQLRDVGWNLTDGRSVRYEYTLADGTRADYVLCDRQGRSMAVVEAKKTSMNPVEAEGKALAYARQLEVPFIFLANGSEVWFWEHEREAHPREIKTFYSQDDLERRMATLAVRRDPLSVPVDRRIVERDYQLECIETLCAEMARGRRKLLVEMATGTGKTRMAAALIKRLFEAGAITRVLFLVDRITLANQTEDAFSEHLAEFPAYVLRASRRFQDEKRITITTLQSMINVYRDYSSGYFDLVITDECHRSIYGTYSGVLKHFDGVQLGLTATPCVVAPEVLARLPDDDDRLFVRDTLMFFEVEKPTFRYTLQQAISEGHLVPYRIYTAMTVKTAAEGGFEVRRDELDWSAMDDKTREEFDELFGDDDGVLVDPNTLERKFTIPERNRAIVREFRDVLDNGYSGSDGVKRYPQDGKTIVFAVTKRHAETLARMFDDIFADRKPSPNVRYADFVVSELGADENTMDAGARIKRFTREEFPKIMVSVNMLDTGFDYPEVVNLVMARFTKSGVLYRQMRGRGTRRADHIKKSAFTIFDFVGVTAFHGDSEEYGDGGFIVPPKTSKPPPQPRRLLVIDVHDHIDPATRNWLVVDADGNLVRAPAGEERANELGMRFETWLLSREEELGAEQLRLLKMIGEQIKANAESMTSFETVRFVDPPFSYGGGIDFALRVFGGEDALDDILAELNAEVFKSEATKAEVKDERKRISLH